MPHPIRAGVMKQQYLRWLVCPVCRQSLALDADFVRCHGCHRRYPVTEGIPVLLADALPESAHLLVTTPGCF